jgi:hypothetical protein
MKNMICDMRIRREKVRRNKTLNGIDYLEVGRIDNPQTDLEDQRHLRVYFLGKVSVELDKSKILIEGGQRIRDIQVIHVKVRRFDRPEFDDFMEIMVDRAGDFSTYTLRVVEKDEQNLWQPHSAFDPRYNRIEFSFKADCPNEFDCKTREICPDKKTKEPEINYLARDYAGFRQSILDRLALIMPEWKERHVPDIGVALVEVMAYVGDHLSYYQDAVATEAYLNTARKRISVRRHGRLVDYRMHEGCNARTWVCVEVESDLPPVKPDDIYFITHPDQSLSDIGILMNEHDLEQFSSAKYEVYEPVINNDIHLYKNHNQIDFYTWEDRQCCIPAGATSATLTGELIHSGRSKNDPDCENVKETGQPGFGLAQIALRPKVSPPELHLNPGDVLIFEEVIGPETGHPEDADPARRHAVCLTSVTGGMDPLNGLPVVHITWDEADALPFPLCLSVLGPPPECRAIDNVSIARGNAILVDHGKTVIEYLGEVQEKDSMGCCKDEGMPAESIRTAQRFTPSLRFAPLTFREPSPGIKPAAYTLKQDVRNAVPEIRLISYDENVGNQFWLPLPDLLSGRSDDLYFVTEIDDEGYAHLRFGNGELGKKPLPGMKFEAEYRIGNGLSGNVGAGSISHAVYRNSFPDGILKVRNPLPAQGGTESEPVSEAKLLASHEFRKDLQRAVIPDDYAAIVLKEFKGKVQNAVATIRWNGSWHEVWVAVDPYGREEADQVLLDKIARKLHRYRLIGHDLRVKPAHRVPLDIGLSICIGPNYLRGHIKAELLKIFSNKRLTDGTLGFFHPDNLTFGDDIYLSKIIAAAQAVQGVESVKVTRMKRWGKAENNEIENGVLPLSPLEIARLDNDPVFPENGKLSLDVRGGR